MVRELLEEYPLFKKYKFKGPLNEDCSLWQKAPVNMHCPKCGSIQTFSMVNNYEYYQDRYRTNLQDQVRDLQYECQSCHLFERRFLVHIGNDLQTVYKAGQYPGWEIKIDKDIERALGRHSDNFKKGLACESQSYGIGAFAYYRRITEDIIDELLSSISNLIEPDHKETYEAALAKAKSTRVAQEKINFVKNHLPSTLKPDGMNPLGVLHSALSGGLHVESDEKLPRKCNSYKKHFNFSDRSNYQQTGVCEDLHCKYEIAP